MSADNWLAVVLKNGKYYAYDLSVSCEYSLRKIKKMPGKNAQFISDTLEGALCEAEDYCRENMVEYGYSFLNLPKESKKSI